MWTYVLHNMCVDGTFIELLKPPMYPYLTTNGGHCYPESKPRQSMEPTGHDAGRLFSL